MTPSRWALVFAAVLTAACSDEAARDAASASPDPAGSVRTEAGTPPRPTSTAAPALTADCDYPVRGAEAAESILGRFGVDAQRATLSGPEGTELPGIVLWPNDAARRVEVILSDEAPLRAGALRFGRGSRWLVGGLRIGDTAEQVARVNGAAFTLYGFEWDYGGYVTDWRGGILARQPGKCAVKARLVPGENAPVAPSLVGDRAVASDAVGMGAARAAVSELSLELTGD